MAKQLISSDEAVQATHQHSKPCGDCPWTRKALPGWLGGETPQQWVATAHSDAHIECHTLLGAQCAGAAIYRANVCKSPRDSTTLRLPSDRGIVFALPSEFVEYHTR